MHNHIIPYNVEIHKITLEANTGMCLNFKNSDEDVFIYQFMGYTPFATTPPPKYTYNYHTGLDFTGKVVKEIVAFETGIVVKLANSNTTTGFGNHIEIQDKNGVVYRYAHLSKILVKLGQEVQEGEVIGIEGSTGFSTGSHLHFDIRKSLKVESIDNKEKYIAQWINPLTLIFDKMKNYNENVEMKKIMSEYFMTNSPHLVQHAKNKGWVNDESLRQYTNNSTRIGILNEVYGAIHSRDIDQDGLRHYNNLLASPIDVLRGERN